MRPLYFQSRTPTVQKLAHAVHPTIRGIRLQAFVDPRPPRRIFRVHIPIACSSGRYASTMMSSVVQCSRSPFSLALAMLFLPFVTGRTAGTSAASTQRESAAAAG